MNTSAPIVAIDGPAGSGKSTVAKLVASRIGVPHIDTGAIYRAVTLAVLRSGEDINDADAAARLARAATVTSVDGRTHLDGEDVEDEIRGQLVTANVSAVSAHAGVRDAMTPLQRAAAAEAGGVLEGRDIGTVVFPDATVKVFLTASVEERARRRAAQSGGDVAAVAADLERRDALDSERAVAPLTQADDAVALDTTGMTIDEVVDAIVALVADAEGRQDPGYGTGFDRAVEHDDEREPVAEDAETVTEPVRRGRDALPRLVIVGRPNVGKSTLVNRILGERVTIVEHKPGVTRDRTEHVAEHDGRLFLVVDTGGWEHRAEGIAKRIVEQAEAAIARADAVVFVVDVTVGALEDDERYAKALRRADIPVLLVANKADGPRSAAGAHDLYGLGLGEAMPVSAKHGDGVRALLDAALDVMPDPGEIDLDETAMPRVALVGRPNVGKSSLFNKLVGEDRSIVDAVPHTTRDSIDTQVEIDGEPWLFVDTAGLRRKYRSGEDTELYSVDRTRRAIEFADLVLFVIDASEPIGEQDQRLAALVRDAGRGVVLVCNKWDEVDEDRRDDLERELDRLLFFASWAPRVNTSAVTSRGVRRIVPQLRVVWESYRTRVPTAELNRFLREEMDATPPPPGRGGRRVKIKYLTQAQTAPPRFLIFANGRIPSAYMRFIGNRLRARYGFPGVPLPLEDRSSATSDHDGDDED